MKAVVETAGPRPSSGVTDYLPIAEHGIVGDLHSIALVGTDGTDRLVLLPALRLAERLRGDPRQGARRLLPDRADDGRVGAEAALLPGHERPHHALPDPGRRRRGAGLHADRTRGCGTSPPADPARARRPRRDALPRRGAAAVRLRPRGTRDDLPREGRAVPLAIALARARDRGAPAVPRERGARRVHAPPRRDGGVRARAGSRELRAAVVPGGRDPRGVRAHGRVLAAVALAVALPGPLARDDPPLGAHAQADDVRAHRRDRRRADDEPPGAASAAGGTGTTATRGSATRPSRSTRCSGSASPRRRPRSWTG